ncbi:four helix bundle protein [Fluviicola sp.]|uniref:four helix bundle protein n=1 Tax=Fluviicola sp. TaxID=1917219 RepID=UPI002624D4B3|nr:four helix bundle protein [Fluviicola sp.]
MEGVKRFEDLLIWTKSREFSKEIHAIFRHKKEFEERALSNQIIRSSSSIMDNIAEGFERGGNKEFLQYLWISKASAGESRSQLYRALDFGIIQEPEFLELKSKAEMLSVGIYSLIMQIKKSEFKGQKFS